MNSEIIFSSSPYPTHSLPPTLRSYVHHLCAFVQVPPELAGPKTALATASDHVLLAFQELRAVPDEADGLGAAYRALRHLPICPHPCHANPKKATL